MKIIKKTALPIITILIVIGVAFILSIIYKSDVIAPSPTLVFKEFIGLFTRANFYKAIFGTLIRSVLSFLIAFFVALGLAVLASFFETLERLLYPLTVIMRAVPAMSVILLCLIWLRSEKSPYAISFIVVFPLIYTSALGAIKAQDKNLSDMAKVFGVRKRKVLFEMTVPEIAMRLFPEFVSALSFNIKLTVAGEALASTRMSIGFEMSKANANLETARLLALTVVAILLSFILELILKGLVRFIKRICYGYNSRKIEQKLR